MCRLLVVFPAVFVAAVLFLGFSAVARSAPYMQVVDNSNAGRFSASSSWGRSSYSPDRYGRNYRFARPGAGQDPAMFRIRVPSTGRYTVYARWPANAGYNRRSRVGIRTPGGYVWSTVNQRINGGQWVRIGTYRMGAGDRWRVKISRRSSARGYIIADAVKVVAGAPRTRRPGGVTGRDIVRKAKTWLGVPYRYGGTSRDGVDCSGLTYRVFGSLGINLPRTAAEQYRKGVAVSTPAPGVLNFSSYSGSNSVTHVGIAVDGDTMIDAPYPGTVVRYDPISTKYTIGDKRIVPSR